MMRAFVKAAAGTLEPLAADPLGPDEHPFLWVDVATPTHGEIAALAQRFGIDPIAVEDIVEPTQFPKVDDYDDHVLLVLHGLGLDDGSDVTTHEIDAIATPTVLLTFHREALPGLEWLIERAGENESMAEGGPDRMLARLAEITTRRFLPVIDEFDARIDALEDLSLSAHPSVVGTTQALRHDAINLRRVLAPQREVMLSLAREGHPVIGDRARQRFGDVHDHLFRVVESLDTARALLASVVDTYRSTVAENMNDVMKVLTVFSAILLPLSVLAGIYGMNFSNMPELDWRWAYFGVLTVMASVALGLWVYFSRRGFIGGPRLSRFSRGLGKGFGLGIKSLEYGAKGIGAGLKGLVDVSSAPVRLFASGIRSLSVDEEPEDPVPPA
ncbi:MAG TPA: magnesium/cobalt transporter CorA [Acidimicrobiia bacterium]|nr:magnesium/cobalt transporter CorA [Acidimicrobiia bacterium]